METPEPMPITPTPDAPRTAPRTAPPTAPPTDLPTFCDWLESRKHIRRGITADFVNDTLRDRRCREIFSTTHIQDRNHLESLMRRANGHNSVAPAAIKTGVRLLAQYRKYLKSLTG